MPCIPLKGGGFVCLGNDPVYIVYNGRRHYFTWTDACGWVACDKYGDERLTKTPEAAWDRLEARHGKKART